MTPCKALRLPVLGVVVATAMAATHPAAAQNISLNYESLSSLEEPIATEIGDVTFSLTGLVDTSLTRDTEDDDAGGADLLGNFQLGALTQLSNRWRVGLTYFGQYATDDAPGSGPDDTYTDNAALSVGGVWGTVLGGDVSGVVREQTRRLRGAGNATLAFDDVLGVLEDRGGGYVGRFGPWVVSTVADGDGNFDLGATFQRPAGNKDYRLTLRATEGVYTAADGSGRFDTRAGGVVGELIYGSMSFDAGAGYERLSSNLSSNGRDADRWYVSSGVRTKTGVVSLSLEGHFGRIEGEDEVSAAFGLQYDVARGLSANLGLNYAKARVMLDGARFVDTRDSVAVLSLRYSF